MITVVDPLSAAKIMTSSLVLGEYTAAFSYLGRLGCVCMKDGSLILDSGKLMYSNMVVRWQ